MRIRQLAVELGSTDRGWRNSLKAHALLAVIVMTLLAVMVVKLSLMKNYFGFE
jgi:hypothetical protein